ncbi:hypothetical protein JG30_10130 [Bombilactobacillus mellifer]|uniref:BspA family leucine-rich repeat surface protein n=2 Tax=Bombilactobacillus mellifer TaxID=1218492 RepID=A0A0F4LTN2_9LACO|nr:hypothetical protein JG30_10130 [Bombilactobacillus mellifer]
MKLYSCSRKFFRFTLLIFALISQMFWIQCNLVRADSNLNVQTKSATSGVFVNTSSLARQFDQLHVVPLAQKVTPIKVGNSQLLMREAVGPADIKYYLTNNDTTLVIQGNQTIDGPRISGSIVPQWPWYGQEHVAMRAKITTIELEGDLYLQGDISQMFASFPALTAIHFNDHIFDTSKIYSMFGLFKDDTSLIKVDLSGLQTQNLTNFSRVFQTDTSLTEVKLPTYTDQVRDFSALFASCSSLTTISGIDSWTGSNATNVASMFDGDAKLEKLDLTKFNPSKATDFSYMFYHCTALSSVGDLSKWTGSNATNVSSMFDGDEALTSLDLTNFNPSGATSFFGMFSGCSKLTSVGDLNKWTGSNATNVAYMFNGDEALTSLDLTNFNPSGATSFLGMFSGCSKLTSVGDLNKWTGSNATNVAYMFNGDIALTSLDLTNFNPSGATSFLGMFSGCSKLTSVGDLSQWTGSNATTVAYMFDQDSSLSKLNLSKFNPSQATNFSSMFSNCKALQDLSSVNSWHIGEATAIDYMFYYDSKLSKPIVLNNSNDPNNSSVQKNKLGSAKQTFAGCSQLTQLDISKLNLTQANRKDFLAGCNNLWYLTLGKNSVLTNSSLPNAPDSDNPKDYPGDPDNKKLICDSGTWIDKSEISDTSSTKKQYTSSDLCNLTLEDLSNLTSAGSKTFVWTPTAVTANLVGFPKNIKFNLMNTGIGTTVQGSDVQDPDNSFSVYDTTGHLKQNPVTTVSAKLISQSTNESDDNPVVFVGHNNHQLRKSQIQLAIGINNLNRLSGDVVLDTDFKPIIRYNPSSNNFKYKFNSQFKLSTYNSVVYLPDSYRATIEYQVIHSVK